MNVAMKAAILSVLSCQIGYAAILKIKEDSDSNNVSSKIFDEVGSKFLHALDIDAQVHLSASAMLRDSISTAATTFNEMEADSEMGTDLGMDLALDSNHGPAAGGGGGGGPATLAEYCAGPSDEEKKAKFAKGTKVKANWGGYGTMYPGKISDENEDGTVDINYDDGFDEKNVDTDEVKVRKKQGSLLFQLMGKAGSAANPANDPACKMQDFLAKLQNQLKDLNKMISQWSAMQRAKIVQADAPKPPPQAAAPSAAPPAAPATEEDLDKLKQQLADKDEYVKELEKQVEENNKELEKSTPVPAAGAPAAAGIPTVDDLIAQYTAMIAQSDARIEELLGVIREQEKEFMRLGAFQLSLKDIDDAVKALEKYLEEAKKKRDELKKEGSLDPELRSVIDSIVKALEKMRKKVDNLIATEAKAEHEAEKAAEAARKKAEEEGKDPNEAAAHAAKAAKKKADLDTMKAAKDVEKDLKEAEQGATKLDTGLHPHGDKWWRYRYEHSYIESMIMIFICWLFLVWSEFVTHMKRRIKGWSSDPSSDPETLEEHEETHRAESHGVVYLVWLNTFAEQMMVCLLVFLTVWLIAKTHLAEFFPMIIKPSEDMRVPNTAGEYRRLALDICTIFFFAIVFYFSLMFPVAHDARIMTSELEEFENKASGSSQAAERKKKMSAATMGTVAETANDFVLVKRHFQNHMEHEIKYNDNPGYKEISAMLNDDLTKFPLWMYLKMNVRESISVFFKFDWRLWLPIIGLFVVFMLLHRFAHMGYVRIMGFFAMMTLALIIVMGCFTKSIAREIHNVDEVEAGPRKKSIHEDYNTESIALCLLQFAMFVVCYGVARMICQPWMWELHFWPVFSLTLLALFSAFLFVWLVSPAIPRFCAAMAMPPYVDADNLQQMHAVASSVQGVVRTGGKKRISRNSTGIMMA